MDKNAVDKTAVDKHDVDKHDVDKHDVDKHDVDKIAEVHAFVEAERPSPELMINVYPPGIGPFTRGCSRPKEVPISKSVENKATRTRGDIRPVKLPDTTHNEAVQSWVDSCPKVDKDPVPPMTTKHLNALYAKRDALTKAEDAYQRQWMSRSTSPHDQTRLHVAIKECKKQEKRISETTDKIRNLSLEK